MLDHCGFILTRQWRDTSDGVELEFWLSTDTSPARLLFTQQRPVFFIAAPLLETLQTALQGFEVSFESVPLRDFSGAAVLACYFSSQRTLRQARDIALALDIQPLESDINPHDRFLMERFIRGGVSWVADMPGQSGAALAASHTVVNPKIKALDYRPQFKVVSLDIETAMQGLQLYSIALYAVGDNQAVEKVLMVADAPVVSAELDIECYASEKQLLQRFLQWLCEYDPDIVIGWNVVQFDMWFLQQLCDRYRLPFTLGRLAAPARWRELDEESGRRLLLVSGRVVLDGIDLLKSATYQFESFALNYVATALLGEQKLIQGSQRGDSITELFQQDKVALARYNLHDCALVWRIFAKVGLIDFAIARTRMTGLPLDRVGGSVASFDFRYLPLLHRAGFVAPNNHWRDDIEHSPGGLVMNSRPGLYEHVLVFDFKSLYPSIIRSFKIDPLGLVLASLGELDQLALVPGFKGAWFSKQQNILPALVSELWQAREAAKAANDMALSQAIKIIMNSFYGVLGSSGCRFFDPRLATSITRRGHQIIQQTADYIERESLVKAHSEVIYGDTDSVFVWVKNVAGSAVQDIGQQLAAQLNRWWRQRLHREYGVDSALEIQFESHFEKFLMPTVRGSEQGSKKRYAGMLAATAGGEPKLVFKGLENVRSDWTPLARQFQQEVYRRVFLEQSYAEYVQQEVRALLAGERDQALLYRKRLRRRLQDYQRNIPPHVQAARKAAALGVNFNRGDWVEYVITVNGAEPAVAQASLLDYQHYIDRQLAPAADSILQVLGDSVAAIIDRQLTLFG